MSLASLTFNSADELFNLTKHRDPAFLEALEAHDPAATTEELLDWVARVFDGQVPDTPLEIRHICLAPRGIEALFTIEDVAAAPHALQPGPGEGPDLPPWQADPRLAPRVRDILDTVAAGTKHVISPDSGARLPVLCNLDMESYLAAEGTGRVIVAQWVEHAKRHADNVWISLRDRRIHYNPRALPRSWIPGTFAKTLACAVHHAGAIARQVRDPQPPRQILVLETPFPHIGHHIWNGISGWETLGRYLPAGDPRLRAGYFARVNEFCTVRELRPAAIPPENVLRLANAHDARRRAFEEGALIQLLKDNFLRSATIETVMRTAREKSDPAFRDRLAAMRRSCYPLVLLTIRTDNRAWVNQAAGWPDLIARLRRRFPRLGVVIDGTNSDVVKAGSHALMSVEEEHRLAAGIEAAIGDPAQVLNTVDMPVPHSLTAGEACDLFVAPLGAGMAKYRWINNLPGVVFSNPTFLHRRDPDSLLYDHFRDVPEKSVYLDPAAVVEVEDSYAGTRRANFDVDVAALAEAVLGLIDGLAGLHRDTDRDGTG